MRSLNSVREIAFTWLTGERRHIDQPNSRVRELFRTHANGNSLSVASSWASVHTCLPRRGREKQSVPSTGNVYTDRLQPSCVAFGVPGISILMQISCKRYAALRTCHSRCEFQNVSFLPRRSAWSRSSLSLSQPVTHASYIANCRVINCTREAQQTFVTARDVHRA